MSLGDLEAFISEQEKRAATAMPDRKDSPLERERGSGPVDSFSGKHSGEPGKNFV